jgi:hypothetical protein
MTLAEFLADPDAWLGREVTVEGGWLHSNGWDWVCLSDGPRFERELMAVEAPWVARWLNSHIPPRPGAPSAYMFEASVKGTVQPRNRENVPVLGGELYVVLRHSGSLHLRTPDAEPGAAADGGGM